MSSRAPVSKGLESVALALIFAPEPFSTLIGVGLLALAKASKANRVTSTEAPLMVNRFEDYYHCKVHMEKAGIVSYKITPRKEGQIPHIPPQTVKLCETAAWKHYRKTAYNYLDTKPLQKTHFSGIQRGLLKDVNRGTNRKKD